MIRFGGLATGQDTSKMVEAMLDAERVPIRRFENEIVEEEEKYSAWSDLDTKFSDLHSKVQKLTSFLTWRQNDVTSTNEAVVTGSANFEASLSSYNVNVTSIAQSQMVGSSAQSSTDTPLGINGSFTLNGEVITVSVDDNLEQIRDSINNSSTNMNDKVTASIINTTLVIKRESTGNTNINVDDDSDSVLQTLGIWDGANFNNELQAGQDLAATVNGVTVNGSSNTNITNVIQGITLNFRSEGTSVLDVSRDTDTIKSAFEDFVDSYNAAIELAEEHTKVSLSGSGERITDVGVLQGEQAVSSMRFTARGLITSRLDNSDNNTFATLQGIGIWTDGNSNRLSILSSDRLSDALENNFDDVEDLIRDFNSGILKNFEAFTDKVRTPVDGTIARNLTSIRNSIFDKEERIQDINKLIASKETDLYQKFANMESAIAGIRSQGDFLSSQLG